MTLQGKNVFFLGSSVTYGSAAGGVSYAELMAEQCGLNCIKEAVSGTTLADIGPDSYVSRLKKHGRETAVDLVICQLSTNDATRRLPLAQTEEAIRFIVRYARDTWGCPVVFYTGTYYQSDAYADMVTLLHRLRKECGYEILDLYNDAEMRAVSEDDYARFMDDPIHPNLVGYREWWTPKFIAFCEELS